VHVVSIDNFSLPQIEKASQLHNFDAALVFATKYELPDSLSWTHFGDEAWNKEYFGYHYDLPPALIAKLLHGDVVWLAKTRGLWTAVLLFNRPQRAGISASSQPLQTYATSLSPRNAQSLQSGVSR
jgi:hypothetical protein